MTSKKNFKLLALTVFVLFISTGCFDSPQDKLVASAAKLKVISWLVMIFTAIAISFVTLFGNQIAEWLRKEIVIHFKIPITTQITLGVIAYAGFILFSLILSWRLGAFLPAFILIAATIYPFFGEYIPALRENNLARRKIAMGKLKTLWLFILVILALFIILSESFIRKFVQL